MLLSESKLHNRELCWRSHLSVYDSELTEKKLSTAKLNTILDSIYHLKEIKSLLETIKSISNRLLNYNYMKEESSDTHVLV